MSEKTDHPWTAGAGILVSLYSHAEAGGVFPFKFDSGVDEDFRIGYHAVAIREDKDNLCQIEPVLFETDPRRLIVVANDLIAQIQEDYLSADSTSISKDYSSVVTGFKTYLNFHTSLIRTKNNPVQNDPTWIFNPSDFNSVLPTFAIEVVANAYREFVRENLAFHYSKDKFEKVDQAVRNFEGGEFAWYYATKAYSEFEAHISKEIRAGSKDPVFRKILNKAARESSLIIKKILENHGFECSINECDSLPSGSEPTSPIPLAVRITNVDQYRERLKKKVAPIQQ